MRTSKIVKHIVPFALYEKTMESWDCWGERLFVSSYNTVVTAEWVESDVKDGEWGLFVKVFEMDCDTLQDKSLCFSGYMDRTDPKLTLLFKNEDKGLKVATQIALEGLSSII